MKIGTTAFAALVLIPLVFSASQLYAVSVTAPTKAYHVNSTTADTATCDSVTTYSYNVTWKPVFETWNQNRAPSVWTHYFVATRNCAVTSVIICGAMCTVRASGCDINIAYSWMKVGTYLNDGHTLTGSPMSIGGIPRPTPTRVEQTLQCLNQ